MALIFNIDTATEKASVCLSENEIIIDFFESEYQKEHASFIHQAIKQILNNAGKSLAETDAFSVTSGPGSYTGLRVGMATAKGFCYALSKPLILVNTLEVMVLAAKSIIEDPCSVLYCPMIDARRMEVFTALYDGNYNKIVNPTSVVLDESFYIEHLQNNKIIFFGNGSQKIKTLLKHPNSSFVDVNHNATHLSKLAKIAYDKEKFSDVTYSHPDYFKGFFVK